MNLMLNAFYAQAVADAVGNPFEFGEPKVTQVMKFINSREDLFLTDDTQMALFGLEAMLKLARVGRLQSIADLDLEIQQSYLDWLCTQNYSFDAMKAGAIGLLAQPLMYRREAPGTTCLASLAYLASHRQPPKNDRMGCGSVMRLLPFHFLPEETRLEAAVRSGEVTHGHIRSTIAVKTLMWAYEAVAEGRAPHYPEWVLRAETIKDFGGGWVAPEAVNMALYAYKNATTYEELLVLSIAHPGDSDSVAAIAGSLWGVAGREVPQKLIDRLAHKTIIANLVTEYQDHVCPNPQGGA
jgi:ADP-ribosylglycohydrolase